MTIVQGRSPQNKFKQLLDNENVQALGIFLLSLGIFLLVWELGANAKIFAKGMPSASLTLKELWWWLTNPFFNNGYNDMGIGWNLLISLRRVAIGYIMASVVAVPLGILLGMSKIATKAFNPYVQLLKPVSPLLGCLWVYIYFEIQKKQAFSLF